MFQEGIESTAVLQKVIILLITACVGFVLVNFGRKKGFFTLPETYTKTAVTSGQLFLVFALFILSQAVVIPLFLEFTSQKAQAVAGIPTGLFVLGLAFLFMPKKVSASIWNQSDLPWYKNAVFGVLMLLLTYPSMIAINQGVSLLVTLIHGSYDIDQLAVAQVKKTFDDPWLFVGTIFSTALVVPFIEEFLFRGVLQSWMRERWNSRKAAIFFASIVFAVFHYSERQGVLNIELLLSLFCLSCLIGLTYERQRSLYAPIAFHSLFNLTSLLLLYLEK